MEFKLNKIDTDLRQRIDQERSEDKIHNKKGINVNKDKEKTRENAENKKKEKSKESETERATIQENGNIQGSVDNDKGKDLYRGHFIDLRR